jgi:pimeloyl-ACP methyl ester carboxylesterase
MGQRFRVVAPTQRYFGPSPWLDDGQNFSISTHADDLAEFISGVGLEPVSLVGWSYGAAVCLTMAIQWPELVERLIVYEPAIASLVLAPDDAQVAAADRLEMTGSARARITDGDLSGAVRVFMDGVNDQPGAFDNLAPSVREIMVANRRTLPLLFAAPPPTLGCDDLKRLEGIPVVVARGEATRAFYRIAAEWTAACIPASTSILVPDARHLFPVEDHARFTGLLLDLIASSG